MKIGFLSAILPEYTFEQVVDFAAENGFANVEMACWPVGGADRRYAGVTHIDMAALDEKKATEIQDYLEKRNVHISGIGYYPNPLSEDEKMRATAIAHLRNCIVGAEKLGVKVVNTFIGRARGLTFEENMEAFETIWPDLIAFAEAHHVRIGIENCPMYFWNEWPNGDNLASTPAFWREMFRRIPSDAFGLNYDPSHLVWQQMDYIQPIFDFKDRLFHFHVKDARFYPEKYYEYGPFAAPLLYHKPKLPGLGDIQWGVVISALNDVGFQGSLTLEIEDRAFEETLEDRLRALLLSKRFIEQYTL